MDVAKQPTAEPLLTTAELAARDDLTLGGVIVSPSTRTLRGPLGSVDVEPRVMQVLAVLADAAGQVVTRETLFNRCWGGVYVGDDSLNRAVAAVRKAVGTVGGRFEIDTIPRTGYVLKVPKGDTPETQVRSSTRISRRAALGAGSAIAALGAVGLWWRAASNSDRHFDALLQRAESAIRKDSVDERTTRELQEALAVRPDSAKAWGLLAVIKSATAASADPRDAPLSRVIEDAETTARKALAIDPREPNALLALLELQGSTLDWLERDRRLRQIIAIDPKNLNAINDLVLLLQAAGLNRESWSWNERALTIEPLSRALVGRRALKLWIGGHVPQADKVIDQARGLWPSDPWIWGVQFLIFALSGRARAAQAMRDTDPAMIGPPQESEMWRTSLIALDRQLPETIAAARGACIKGASMGAQLGGQAVMILSALGEVDSAFDVANGFLLSRGSLVRRGKRPFKAELNSDAGWRVNTQWLFVPPAAVMRADPRFLPLCEGVGLTDYWRSRGIAPDYQRELV